MKRSNIIVGIIIFVVILFINILTNKKEGYTGQLIGQHMQRDHRLNTNVRRNRNTYTNDVIVYTPLYTKYVLNVETRPQTLYPFY